MHTPGVSINRSVVLSGGGSADALSAATPRPEAPASNKASRNVRRLTCPALTTVIRISFQVFAPGAEDHSPKTMWPPTETPTMFQLDHELPQETSTRDSVTRVTEP